MKNMFKKFCKIKIFCTLFCQMTKSVTVNSVALKNQIMKNNINISTKNLIKVNKQTSSYSLIILNVWVCWHTFIIHVPFHHLVSACHFACFAECLFEDMSRCLRERAFVFLYKWKLSSLITLVGVKWWFAWRCCHVHSDTESTLGSLSALA